jgi:cytochrome b561
MDKQKANKIVDGLMFLAFLVVMISGIISQFFLPKGVIRGGKVEFLGVTKSAWVDIHVWSGMIMAILVIAHIALHWSLISYSIKNTFKKDNSSQEK